VGSQSGSETCILSPPIGGGDKTVCVSASGRPLLPVPVSMFWTVTPPSNMDVFDETACQEVEGRGMLVFVYLDDILVLGETKREVQKNLEKFLQDLDKGGLRVNKEKSTSTPCQEVKHLGLQINLKDGLLQVPEGKMKAIRNEMGKLLTHKEISCRKMPAILGGQELFSSHAFLMGFHRPNAQFYKKKTGNWLGQKAKNLPVPSPGSAGFGKDNARMERQKFSRKDPSKSFAFRFQQFCWGWKGYKNGGKVQEFWRDQKGLHINVKELKSSISVLKSLAKEGELVELVVDNALAFSYLKKGGETTPLKQVDEGFLDLGLGHRFGNFCDLGAQSRGPGRFFKSPHSGSWGLYLGQKVFQEVVQIKQKQGSTRNRYVCQPRKFSVEKILFQGPPLGSVSGRCVEDPPRPGGGVLCKPPWPIIQKWLESLRQNPHITCMMVTPFWVSTPWWPLLVRMQVPSTKAWVIPPITGCSPTVGGRQCHLPVGPYFARRYQASFGGKRGPR